MASHFTPDREFFQMLLAEAFLAQNVLADTPTGASVMDMLSLVRAGKLDLNDATHLIADRAQNISNATGVAIGVLNGDQLFYQAGAGRGADLVGRKVMATLTVSNNIIARREILRVHDAQTELGVGAAICRQFEARSLLMLPIYHNRELAGVLDVFFSEAHPFADREIVTYRLMIRIIEEAMARAVLSQQNKVQVTEPASIPQTLNCDDVMQSFPSDSCAPAGKDESLLLRGRIASSIEPSVPWYTGLWRVADWAAMLTVFVTASWIAFTHTRASSDSQAQISNTLQQQPSNTSPNRVPVQSNLFKLQGRSVPVMDEQKVARSTPPRVSSADNQMDYFSDDVIVRHFVPKSALQQVRTVEVDYISEDVTIRRFNPKSVIGGGRATSDPSPKRSDP